MTTVAWSVGVSIAFVNVIVFSVFICCCKKKQKFCFKPKAQASTDCVEYFEQEIKDPEQATN